MVNREGRGKGMEDQLGRERRELSRGQWKGRGGLDGRVGLEHILKFSIYN
jgi:hypothetical protein